MAFEILLDVDRTREAPLSRQIYEQIVQAISNGRLNSGDQIPSTRELSGQMLVSRSVILQAYGQLQAEGYIVMKKGAGTFIADNAVRADSHRLPADGGDHSAHFQTPQIVSAEPPGAVPYDFRHGIPAWDALPMNHWQRALLEACRGAAPDMLSYGPAEGSLGLREEIARLVRATRSIPATPEQIVITAGATQALDILARLCLRTGGQVVVEDPSHPVLREIFRYSGGEIVPVPVDQEGICVEKIDACLAASGTATDISPRLLYVTPSHQFPAGVTLSYNRRIQLLEWARRTGTWIIEDDYDSEYRYSGQKVSALAGLQGSERVIYVGSFSKILFPALRIGYAILPPALVEPFLAVKWIADRMTPAVEQAALAKFIQSGQYARHVSRMGRAYAVRRTCLTEALNQEFGERVRVFGDEAGLHLLIELETSASEEELALKALEHGVKIYPASSYFIAAKPRHPAFILGYANLSESQIQAGIQQVARAEKACTAAKSDARD